MASGECESRGGKCEGKGTRIGEIMGERERQNARKGKKSVKKWRNRWVWRGVSVNELQILRNIQGAQYCPSEGVPLSSGAHFVTAQSLRPLAHWVDTTWIDKLSPSPQPHAAKKIVRIEWTLTHWVDATHTYMIKIVHRQLII